MSNPAQYLLLLDHYLASGYATAGTTIVEGTAIPFGWVPTLAVDPLNTEAVAAFWAKGPGDLVNGEPNRGMAGPIFRKPQVSWQLLSPGQYILTGAGATLGPKGSG